MSLHRPFAPLVPEGLSDVSAEALGAAVQSLARTHPAAAEVSQLLQAFAQAASFEPRPNDGAHLWVGRYWVLDTANHKFPGGFYALHVRPGPGEVTKLRKVAATERPLPFACAPGPLDALDDAQHRELTELVAAKGHRRLLRPPALAPTVRLPAVARTRGVSAVILPSGFNVYVRQAKEQVLVVEPDPNGLWIAQLWKAGS